MRLIVFLEYFLLALCSSSFSFSLTVSIAFATPLFSSVISSPVSKLIAVNVIFGSGISLGNDDSLAFLFSFSKLCILAFINANFCCLMELTLLILLTSLLVFKILGTLTFDSFFRVD